MTEQLSDIDLAFSMGYKKAVTEIYVEVEKRITYIMTHRANLQQEKIDEVLAEITLLSDVGRCVDNRLRTFLGELKAGREEFRRRGK